jgi:hypothetical protein
MNPTEQNELLAGLPAARQIQEGLRDHRENRLTIPACLVRIARPRLVKAGLMNASKEHMTDAEIDLYQLLTHEGNNAHSRYNALVRELISFEHALDHRLKV